MVPRDSLVDREPPSLQITERQLELLRAIQRWSVQHGRMPSLRELAEVLDRSPSTIHQHLNALERRGYLERNGQSHGLKLTIEPSLLELPEGGTGTLLPMKGYLSPGRRLRRSGTPYPRLSVGGDTRRSDYLLQIVGPRLEGEGIYDGDLLLVRPGSAGDSPAVVQFPDGTADIRRVTTLRDGDLGLLPPRPRLENRRGARRAEGVLIQGRVLRLVRRYS
ncbi:MAG: helix-turn-helix domain-containing protein [Myxococcota bacterium]|nr:helix-turn-helix domain-containing protein [Myxococcota bacterium]